MGVVLSPDGKRRIRDDRARQEALRARPDTLLRAMVRRGRRPSLGRGRLARWREGLHGERELERRLGRRRPDAAGRVAHPGRPGGRWALAVSP